MMWQRELSQTGRPSLVVGGSGALAALRDHAERAGERGSRLFVITDENVRAAWGDTVLSHLGERTDRSDLLALPPGEATKSAGSLERCWDWLADRSCRRSDVVIAVGGGVVGDLAGFAAATYQRGVGLWQLPTSLIAQIDSSVGGKTAINLTAGKNLVGAFYQPDLVLVDPATLATLPEEEYQGGLGEVVKYGLLQAGLLPRLEQARGSVAARDEEALGVFVRDCIEYKSQVVEEDEFDRGRRAVLNLGHTTAHALEVTAGYGAIGHGHAVALGLLVALAVSERILDLDPEIRARTGRLLEAWGLPVTTSLPPIPAVLAAAARDKKVTAAGTGFVGLRSLGQPVWGLEVSAAVLGEALEVIRG